MSDRALIVAALIVGGAIVAATSQMRARFALSAADSSIAWRMDTWSGQIDICAAGYTPKGPVVKCGVYVVQPASPSAAPNAGESGASPAQPPPTGAAPGAGGLGGKEL
jgi:hypothetical protein